MNYRGWTITFSEKRPVTGLWRAERFGVGMCAGTKDAIIRMVDVKVSEEAAARLKQTTDSAL